MPTAHYALNALLPEWFHSGQGRALMASEVRALPSLIPDEFYRVGLQLGWHQQSLLSDLNVEAPVYCDTGMSVDNALPDRVISRPEALPLAEGSVDLVLMLHTLDYCDDPHRVLREITQVLSPEGVLVVSGFHPFSLWGLARKVRSERAPFDARFISRDVMQDRLQLLGFQAVSGTMLNYQLPGLNPHWHRRLAWMDKAGDRWWPTLSAVYVLVLRKKVYGNLMHERASRKTSRWFAGLAPSGASTAQKGDTAVSHRIKQQAE